MMQVLHRLLLLLILVSATACTDSFIDPFSNDGRFFTIYGYIDTHSTQHAVRIIPVTRTPARITSPADGQAQIDATVTSMDMMTGETVTWRHNLEQLSDGSYGHIFRGTFRPRPARTYQLTVTRKDGITTTATVRVPHLAASIPSPDTLFFPYEISPDSAWGQEVVLPGIASPWDIIVTYDLQGLPARVFYGRPGERTADGSWQFTIDPSRDAPAMRQFRGLGENDPLPLLHAIEVQVRVLDEDWDPPGGVFDPEVLAFPDALSNVENGYGHWGAVNLYQYTWIAPPQ